jgi:hypothetical protein
MASAQTTTWAAIFARVLLVFRAPIVKRVTKLKDLVVNIFFGIVNQVPFQDACACKILHNLDLVKSGLVLPKIGVD